MRFGRFAPLVLLATFALSTPALAQEAEPIARESEPESSALYENAVEVFLDEMDRTYPFFDLKGIRPDWETLKPELRERAKSCTTATGFYGILIDALACLRDAHMSLYNTTAPLPEVEREYGPNLSLAPGEDEKVVVLQGPPEHPILRPGTVVLTIEGERAWDWMERRSQERWERGGGGLSSPQRARLYEWRTALCGPEGATTTITIRDFGQEVPVVLRNLYPNTGWLHTYAMPEGLARYGNCSWKKLPSDIGYIHLRRIREDLVPGIDQALRSMGRMKGLIIDLRGNGGGGYGPEVFKRFSPEAEAPREVPRYWGNMAVLIDAGTMSAGETFARDLVYVAGARILGETSAGSSTAKREWNLPHGLGTLRVSTRSRWGFEGRPIEYNGIAPHEVVLVDPADLRRGINTGIRRAEEYLLAEWEKPPDLFALQPTPFPMSRLEDREEAAEEPVPASHTIQNVTY